MNASSGGLNNIFIRDSIIRDNGSYGIRVNYANASIENSEIYGNNTYGIYNGTHNPAYTIEARYNWWGSDSGPYPYGSGNGINYRTCTDPIYGTYICQYYVDVVPWIGYETTYGQDIFWQYYIADPVNTATGNYAYERTDLSIPTRSLPLEFTRSYNSANPQDGRLGWGWSHSYLVYVTEDTTDGSVTVRFGDGHEERYTWNGTAYDSPPGTFSRLEKIAGPLQADLQRPNHLQL